MNAAYAERIAAALGGPPIQLVNMMDYQGKKPHEYLEALMCEYGLLRETIETSVPNGKAILKAMDSPLPGQEFYVAPYREQLKKGKGRGTNDDGESLSPHHLIVGWKIDRHRQQGVINKNASRARSPTVLIGERFHREIHRKDPPIACHPFDTMEWDIERFSEVALKHGFSPQMIDQVAHEIRRMNGECLGIDRPRARGDRMMIIGGDDRGRSDDKGR